MIRHKLKFEELVFKPFKHGHTLDRDIRRQFWVDFFKGLYKQSTSSIINLYSQVHHLHTTKSWAHPPQLFSFRYIINWVGERAKEVLALGRTKFSGFLHPSSGSVEKVALKCRRWLKSNWRQTQPKWSYIIIAFLLGLQISGHKVIPDTTPPLKLAHYEPVKATDYPTKDLVAEVVVYTAPAPKPVEPPVSTYSGSGDEYLDFIISHESGGNPYAYNPSGACGLGQSLPCSKVLSVCGSLDNVSCQIEWVRNYCTQRYGSTYDCYLFWINNRWY